MSPADQGSVLMETTEMTLRNRAILCSAMLVMLSGCVAPRVVRSDTSRPPPVPLSKAQTPPQQTSPQPEILDIRISGHAFAADETSGTYPPGSKLVVRIYDATSSVNAPLIEREFTQGTGRLPWSYELGLRKVDFIKLDRPAVAALLISPTGEIVYRNTDAALMQQGKSDDIPLVKVTPAPAKPAQVI